MANGDCDLACKTKIIINGDNVSKLLEVICEQVEYARDHNLPFPKGHQIIDILNKMEDDACKVQRLVLDCFGYDGPVGKMLQ